MHTNSKLLFDKYGKSYFHPGSRVLEIGPDAFPSSYESLVNDSSIIWETTDISDRGSMTYPNAGEYSFPVSDDSYDVVLTGQVIEHVKKIWVWVKELARVCKKGGHVIIINPVSWPFHEVPVDCWRIYPDGMKALLEDTSLRVVASQFESLEAPGHKRYLPGISAEFQTPKMRLFYRLAGRLGFPVERAYDTITIARKE
jgi:ubiquinone/menaquinone biosynthesis C-methylase UbiE